MKTTTQPETALTQETIAVRAYQRYLDRGCEHGHDVADWLAVEEEVGAELAVEPAAAGSARRARRGARASAEATLSRS